MWRPQPSHGEEISHETSHRYDFTLHDGRIRPGRARRTSSSGARGTNEPSPTSKDNTHDQRSSFAASGYAQRESAGIVSSEIHDHEGRFRRGSNARVGTAWR